jgi:hypothetical protein
MVDGFLENVAQFKYLGKMVTNQNLIQEEIQAMILLCIFVLKYQGLLSFPRPTSLLASVRACVFLCCLPICSHLQHRTTADGLTQFCFCFRPLWIANL